MKTADVKVSIIIPVYNVEKYLDRCLHSIQNQTLAEFEVICVDDGSTDDSVFIMQKYEESDQRFHILHQHNKGAGTARNLGISQAKGEYLLFLDSDDFFSPVLLERTYKRAVDTNADIVLYDGKRFFTDTGRFEPGNYLKALSWGGLDVISRHNVPNEIFIITNPAPWTKLYRKDFILEEGLKYQEIPNSNDLFFSFVALCTAERIAYVNESLVYYRMNHGANIQKRKVKNPTVFIDAYMAVYRELQRRGIYAEVEKAFVDVVVGGFSYNFNTIKDTQARNRICERLLSAEIEETGILKKPLEFYRTKGHINNVLGNLNGYCFEQRKKKVHEETKLELLIENELVNEPLVSVVVPVYNVENYLQETLDSIMGQTLTNMEIICINDGSTDNSLAILKENAQKDSRIKVFSQLNKGLSTTRNRGIQNARGKYLYFMDSDDVLEPIALEVLSSQMEKDNLDVVYFDGSSFSTELGEDDIEVKKYQTYYRRKGCYTGVHSGLEMLDLFLKRREFRSSACLQMIRKEYLLSENIKFHTGILHEDNVFSFLCMVGAKRTGYCQLALFKRRIRKGSIMTNKENFNNAYGYFCCYEDMLKWIEQHDVDMKYYAAIDDVLNSMQNAVRRVYKGLSDAEKGTVSGLTYGEQLRFKKLCE